MTERSLFVFFRISLGLYLFWYFDTLRPYMEELFGVNGIYTKRAEIPFPSVLPALGDARGLMFVSFALMLSSAAIAVGYQRRVMAVIVLYGLACLRSWNGLLSPPSDGYLGWLLLATALIPQGEGSGLHRLRRDWRIPAPILTAALVVFAVSYTCSGLDKLRSEVWTSGQTLGIAFNGPLARVYFINDLLSHAPTIVLKMLTWISLASEVLCAPLCLFARGRKIAWGAILIMHIGALATLVLTSVSLAMLLFNLFLIPIIFPHTSSQQAVDGGDRSI